MREERGPATDPTREGGLSGPAFEYGRFRYAEGDLIGGRFYVHGRARGGFGHVYLCYDREQDYFYALKTLQLTQQALEDPRTLLRLRREVDTWIALGEHDHIVQCFSMEVLDNLPFIVLEWVADDDLLSRLYREHHSGGPMFLDWYARLGRRGLPLRRGEADRNRDSAGTSLAGWIETHGTLPLRLALQVTADVCAGMHHARNIHADLVHRDLKPSNILLTEQRRAKITDFGTVALAEDLFDSDQPPGTLGYMAPEQWRGEDLDPRADIYALGCVLFQMVRGEAPFGSSVLDEEEMRRRHEQVPPPSLPDSVPVDVNDIVQTCLAKDPGDRFSSFADLQSAVSDVYHRLFRSTPLSLPSTWPVTVEDLNQQGIAYYNLEKYDLALEQFDRAIDLDGSYPNTYNNRGCVQHVLGNYREAMRDYANAIRLGRPAINSRVRNNRGLLFTTLGQPKRALRDFRKALDSDPDYANVYVNLGLAYVGMNRQERVLECLARALELDPTHVLALHNCGYLHQLMGRSDEALENYDKALDHDPYLLQGYVNRYLLYQRIGDERNAEYDKARIQRLDPILSEELRSLEPEPVFSRPDTQLLNVESLDELVGRPFLEQRLASRAWDELYGWAPRSANRLPIQPVMRIKDVEYADWMHETVQQAHSQGERVVQIEAQVDLVGGYNLAEPKPNVEQCHIVIDEQAMKMMEAAGFFTIYDLKQQYITLLNEDPDDGQRPLRILNL